MQLYEVRSCFSCFNSLPASLFVVWEAALMVVVLVLSRICLQLIAIRNRFSRRRMSCMTK